VYPKNIAGIADQIEARGSVKPVLYSSLRAFSLINLKWIFGLLLLWLSAEWFLRKFLGGY
jgi:hypothetical protein